MATRQTGMIVVKTIADFVAVRDEAVRACFGTDKVVKIGDVTVMSTAYNKTIFEPGTDPETGEPGYFANGVIPGGLRAIEVFVTLDGQPIRLVVQQGNDTLIKEEAGCVWAEAMFVEMDDNGESWRPLRGNPANNRRMLGYWNRQGIRMGDCPMKPHVFQKVSVLDALAK